MEKKTEPAGGQPEILVVEDGPVEAELLRRCLARAGYRVTMAKDGAEGLQAARAQRPALVVSDIRMPLMNGYELCHEIKHDEGLWNVPVILLTILSEPEDIIEAISSGADSYITKPFVEAILLERIRSLLATPIVRKRAEERRAEEMEYHNKHYTITGCSQQILNLLLSVYESTIVQNRELLNVQAQLNLLNEGLEEKVRERTAALLAEEQKLERVNRALRILSACNGALVRTRAEEELFRQVCRHIVEIGGYLLALVAYPNEAPEGTPRLVAHFGDEAAYQGLAELARRPEQVCHCPAVAALRTRQTQLCNKTYNGGEYSLEKVAELGIGSVLALPLASNDHLYGALAIFSSSPDAFDADEVKLAEELAADLGYGINTLRTRSERDLALEGERDQAAKLREALEQTVAAIALTLEKRDPYTAGHQQRVAEMAAAIASALGLPPQQVEGVHFGALIHDVGKVYVPAEILSRPGKLTESEFKIIKAHPQVGFDIVKDIPFPWPVAQMVLQHHERMDGSGYPLGLKGEETILEARILAVADVVEAMAAHRPYRAALGIPAAMEELGRGRGTLFDPAAVDACLHLIRENSFAFTNP